MTDTDHENAPIIVDPIDYQVSLECMDSDRRRNLMASRVIRGLAAMRSSTSKSSSWYRLAAKDPKLRIPCSAI